SGMTFVSRAHGMDLYAERHQPAYLPLQGAVVEAADAIFPVSDHGRTYLGERYPEIRTPITVARLGVRDPGRLSKPSDDGCWRVLSCSGLVPVKRVDRLVRGLADLGRRNPERQIHWTHLGDGAQRTV